MCPPIASNFHQDKNTETNTHRKDTMIDEIQKDGSPLTTGKPTPANLPLELAIERLIATQMRWHELGCTHQIAQAGFFAGWFSRACGMEHPTMEQAGVCWDSFRIGYAEAAGAANWLPRERQ